MPAQAGKGLNLSGVLQMPVQIPRGSRGPHALWKGMGSPGLWLGKHQGPNQGCWECPVHLSGQRGWEGNPVNPRLGLHKVLGRSKFQLLE